MSEDRRGMGEETLIATHFAPLAASFAGALGLADDCAWIPLPRGADLIVTTDAIAAGVHFFPDDPAFDIGWKALAVNVSDLIAKGAEPFAYQMAVAFPEMPETEWLEGLTSGLRKAQDHFGLVLSGGDTDRRPGPLSITITAFGRVRAGRMVRRATAKAGDVLLVSGVIGDSALGLKLRTDPGLGPRLGLAQDAVMRLVGRYLRPEPPLGLRDALVEHAGAAMDISDGLVKDLGRLARASGVAAVIDAHRVPLSDDMRAALAADPGLLPAALTGGDDYEVLAAVRPDRVADFKAEARNAGISVTEIGGLEPGEGVRVHDECGASLHLNRAGWDHFA